ncbi:MAG: hypothetical protein WCQ21_13775 [Verrucomicrobiota bacterium]
MIFERLGAFGGIEPPLRAVGENAPGQFAIAQAGDEFGGPETADGFVIQGRAGRDDVEQRDAVGETVVLIKRIEPAREGRVVDDEAEIAESGLDVAAPERVGAGGVAALPPLAEGDEAALGVIGAGEAALEFVEEQGAGKAGVSHEETGFNHGWTRSVYLNQMPLKYQKPLYLQG